MHGVPFSRGKPKLVYTDNSLPDFLDDYESMMFWVSKKTNIKNFNSSEGDFAANPSFGCIEVYGKMDMRQLAGLQGRILVAGSRIGFFIVFLIRIS